MPQKITLPREIAGIRLPDSALAQKAVDLAYRVSPPVVWTHVVRTFVFGALVGQAQNLRYDEELFFLAAVLHDLGLTAEFRGAERFEVVGADAADAFLKDHGLDPERREIIWDAIARTSVGSGAARSSRNAAQQSPSAHFVENMPGTPGHPGRSRSVRRLARGARR